jgi:hypothetical protein
MPAEIRWKTSMSASCLHAVACEHEGVAAADAELATVIGPPAQWLIAAIAAAHWPIEDVLAELVCQAADFENNRELVSRAVARRRIHATESAIGRVAGAIADVEAAMRRARPELAEELAVRGRPLMEQWQARGPGMLLEMGRMTDEGVVPEFAEVVLVAPYAGGHGRAHASQNRATFEAVLVNPHAELPETVRLAWLVAQLNADLPRFADVLGAQFSAHAFQAAMLAPTLAAAEVVELARCDEATLALAIGAWRLERALPADAATQIWQWWQTWLDEASPWPVAVAALAAMLRGDDGGSPPGVDAAPEPSV